MRVNLRISSRTDDLTGKPKRGRPKKCAPMYTPAVIDASRIDFAFVDEEGDINIRYVGTEEYYAIQHSEGLFDKICDIVDNKFPKVKGLSK